MKTISDYAIHCTPEQTRKALELGAPINKRYNRFTDFTECILDKPTAEQMIGWLRRSHNVRIELYTIAAIPIYHIKFPNGTIEEDSLFEHNMTYSEIYNENTLAAIDAALEYLENLK